VRTVIVAASVANCASIAMPDARRPAFIRFAHSLGLPPAAQAARLPRASSPRRFAGGSARCGPLARRNRRHRRRCRRAAVPSPRGGALKARIAACATNAVAMDFASAPPQPFPTTRAHAAPNPLHATSLRL
jgi:hypothetical protein